MLKKMCVLMGWGVRVEPYEVLLIMVMNFLPRFLNKGSGFLRYFFFFPVAKQHQPGHMPPHCEGL